MGWSENGDLVGFSFTVISTIYRQRSEKEKISSELLEVRGEQPGSFKMIGRQN